MQREQSVDKTKGIKNGEEEIFASHLPPRSEYHKKKNSDQSEEQTEQKNRSRARKQEKFTTTKILAFIFLLLPIIIGGYLFYRELNQIPVINDDNSDSFEQVEIGK